MTRSQSQLSVLVQYILDCGCDFNRNSMGGTGKLVREVDFLGFGLVERCGNWRFN